MKASTTNRVLAIMITLSALSLTDASTSKDLSCIKTSLYLLRSRRSKSLSFILPTLVYFSAIFKIFL
jgi:hypothetical protein